MTPFAWFIGMRYTRGARRAGGRDGFISFIAWMSVAGIALGVAALIVVLAVINGFQREVRDRMLAVVPHVEIYGRQAGIDWPQVAALARADARVVAAAPFVSGQAVATRDETMRGAVVRGIDVAAEKTVSSIARDLKGGSLDDLKPGGAGVVLGKALAAQLRVGLGERVVLIAPQNDPRLRGGAAGAGAGAGAGPAAGTGVAALSPRVRQFTLVGLFESGHHDYDSSLVLMQIDDAMRFFGSDGPTGLRLRTSDLDQAPAIGRDLAARLGRNFVVRDWSTENRIWFASVQVQKRMLSIILALIVGVAAFNLVSMLVMAVTDKQADIAILRTLGASRQAILAIFMIQGAAVGLIGTLAGVALGVLLSLELGAIVKAVEALFGFRVLDPAVYLLSELPTELRLFDVGWIAVVSLLLALVATVYPSLRAARTRPVEALRHE